MLDTKLLLLALSYRLVYDGFGSYLAARVRAGLVPLDPGGHGAADRMDRRLALRPKHQTLIS